MRERERESREGLRCEKETEILLIWRFFVFFFKFWLMFATLYKILKPWFPLFVPHVSHMISDSVKKTKTSLPQLHPLFQAISPWNHTTTGNVSLLSQMAASFPQHPWVHMDHKGAIFALFVCILPRHTLIYIYILHLHIWIKYSLAVHLHCNMLTETTISCFL